MTLTMKRLPNDSFLPSGAVLDPNEHILSYTGLVNGHSGHFISPLALPHTAGKVSYFDDPPSNYKHQATSGGEAQSQTQRRYLSPHQSPPESRDQRPASLSPPTLYPNQQNRAYIVGSGITSPSLTPLNDACLTTSPEQAAYQLRRVTLQNRRLLENWEAERAHLEANRARAEEIYKEERAIMDEERLVWVEEKRQLLARVSSLERDKAELLVRLNQMQSPESRRHDRGKDARDSAIAGIRGDSTISPEKLSSPANGKIPTVKFRTPSDGISPPVNVGLGHGHTMPESHPFDPLDPRMQSASPPIPSPDTESPDKERALSIDVQVIHPDLEGIPIKARAVQKATFTDGKSSSSTGSKKTSTSGSNQDSPTGRMKTSPGELTKETLKAPESHRLRMHAGHTPNHSLSQLVTVLSTEAPNTAGSSGTSTPSHNPLDRNLDTSEGEAKGKGIERSHHVSEGSNLDGNFGADEEGGMPHLEPSEEDPELKGPLTLRNMPAHDEPFLRRLSDKLEDSLKTDNATPTVLKNGAVDSIAGPENEAPPAGTNGANDSQQPQNNEDDIPLKFKKNNNFGAPLGALSDK